MVRGLALLVLFLLDGASYGAGTVQLPEGAYCFLEGVNLVCIGVPPADEVSEEEDCPYDECFPEEGPDDFHPGSGSYSIDV
jgi:hypothetical protein